MSMQVHDRPALSQLQAASSPDLTPEQAAQLAAGTGMVRAYLATNPACPTDVVVDLARDDDMTVVAAAMAELTRRATSPGTTWPLTVLLTEAAQSPHRQQRLIAARNPHTPQRLRLSLAVDSDPAVRNEARTRLPQDIQRILATPAPPAPLTLRVPRPGRSAAAAQLQR